MTRDEALSLWRAVTGNLLEKVRLIPDDAPHLDEPAWQGLFATAEGEVEEAMMTPRQMLAHLVVGSYDVPRALVTGSGHDAIRQAAAELVKLPPSGLAHALEQRLEKLYGFIGELPEQRFGETIATPLGERTVGEVLTFTALHVVHHKGQLMLLMRLMGLRPGRFV